MGAIMYMSRQYGGGGSEVIDGSSITPTDDISIWLACAELTEPYTTLLQVLADDDVMEKLFRSENASDYLVRSTTWASDITADQTAMILIGANDYCADKLLSDSTWSTAISSSEYWNRVLIGLVPTMTSNTSNGIASADSEAVIDTTYYAYLAFDNNPSTRWISNIQYSSGASFSGWIKYDYTDNRKNAVKKIFVKNGNNAPINGLTLQGSNDDNTYTTVATITGLNIGNGGEYFANIENTTKYRYYKLLIEGQTTATGRAPQLYTFQMYGRISKTTIYSAANDIVSFIDDEGAKVVTTDATGKGEVVIVCKPNTDITFTSSVAKNPNNLNENYSKVVTFKSNEPVYVMPNKNVLYWYGYKSSNVEDATAANGWSRTSYTFIAPTSQTNRVYAANSSTNQYVGIGTKTGISGSKVHFISSKTNIQVELRGVTAKNAFTSEGTKISLDNTSENINHLYAEYSMSNMYIWVGVHNLTFDISGYIYAVWYDDDDSDDKAEISAIGTNEDKPTASKDYKCGEHFYKNGKFCTCIAPSGIAQGAQFTLGTNYVKGDIASLMPTYNYDERATGEYWIDGKPIYEKTVIFTTGPNNSAVMVDTGVQIDQVVDWNSYMVSTAGTGNRTNATEFDLNRRDSEFAVYTNRNTVSGRPNKAVWASSSDLAVLQAYLRIKYTKI